jgi:anti-anti-sigma factor
MLELLVERHADTAILHCVGRIIAGDEGRRLRSVVMCQADKRVVLLDLAGVDRIDAGGLGLLVSLQTLGYAVGFELQVTNPQPIVREVLELTGLGSVLEIVHSDEVDATQPMLQENTEKNCTVAA